MIDEGEPAPTFELPAVVDGEHRRVGLSEFLGEDVIILAFYPGDFNPACDEESDLDELDLFTMQKDVTVLAIGPDTLFAHEAFADAYDLHIPLLSDTRREVAERYGVAYEGELGQALVERAVFVIDHDGDVAYTWHTRDLAELPVTEAIKDAIGETGGDETAFARYTVGHAHYVEGRRAFTSAMHSFADSEWMIAQSDFQRAREEFTEAAEHFDSAVRFVDDELFGEHYETAEEKATHLWQAADWLAKAASHYSSGRGAEGQQLRDDAERPLEEARIIAEPIDPDDWPPGGPPERTAPEESDTFLPEDGDDGAVPSLELDESGVDATDAADRADEPGDADEGAAGDIDDDELAEIEAELTDAPSDDPVDAPPDERRSVIDTPPADDDQSSEQSTDDDPTSEPSPDTGQVGDEGAPDGSSGHADATTDDVAIGPDRRAANDAATADEITEDDLAELGAEIAASGPKDDEKSDARTASTAENEEQTDESPANRDEERSDAAPTRDEGVGTPTGNDDAKPANEPEHRNDDAKSAEDTENGDDDRSG